MSKRSNIKKDTKQFTDELKAVNPNLTLVKDNERYGWRIYSIGDPLEHYKDTLGLRESMWKVYKDSKGFIKRRIIKRLIEK